MRITKSTQDGFGTPFMIIIAALIVIGAVTVGIMVYHSDKTTKSLSSAATNPPQSTKKSSTSTTDQSQQSATTYLNITQWGIELPLSSSISDAYYVAPDMSPDPDGKTSGIILGVTSLNTTCGTVTADANGFNNNLGEIVRSLPTATDPVSGQLYTQENPYGTTINGYYYSYTGDLSGKTCASSSALSSIQSAFENAVKNAVAAPTSSGSAN